MPKIDEQIDAIERKMEQHRNRLRDLKAQATKQERKDDARRKLLYGAAYLAGLETLSEDARKRSRTRVEALITRPKDREFLGLEPLDASDENDVSSSRRKDSDNPELPFGPAGHSE